MNVQALTAFAIILFLVNRKVSAAVVNCFPLLLAFYHSFKPRRSTDALPRFVRDGTERPAQGSFPETERGEVVSWFHV